MNKNIFLLTVSALYSNSIVANINYVASKNILFIICDDLRPELNCYGNSMIVSPNIDELANNSVVFNRAYCNIPVSGASRAKASLPGYAQLSLDLFHGMQELIRMLLMQ